MPKAGPRYQFPDVDLGMALAMPVDAHLTDVVAEHRSRVCFGIAGALY